MQIEIGIGDLGPEAVRVFEFHIAAVPQVRANPVPRWRSFQAAHEETRLVSFGHGHALRPADHLCRFGLREKGTHFPPLAGTLFADGVWPQNTERISVIPSDYCFNLFGSHETLNQVWPISCRACQKRSCMSTW